MPSTARGPAGANEQQFAQVLREDLDRLLVRGFLLLGQERRFQGRKQQPPAAIGHRLGQFLPEQERRVGDQAAGQPAEERFVVDLDRQPQNLFRLSAPHGQVAMRRHFGQRLAVVVIHLELAGLSRPIAADPGDEHPALDRLAHHAAKRAVVGPLLGNDVAGPAQGRLGVGHVAVGIDVRPQHLGAGSARVDLSLEHGREPFQPALAGDGGAGAAFGLVGQVEFFEFFLLAAGEDLLPQGSVQLALLGDGLENRVLPLDQLAERVDRVLDRAEGRFVQAPGAFLAIPRHERDRVALAQKLGGRLDLGLRKPQRRRDRRNFPSKSNRSSSVSFISRLARRLFIVSTLPNVPR